MDNAETIFYFLQKPDVTGVKSYNRGIEAHEHIAMRTGGVRY